MRIRLSQSTLAGPLAKARRRYRFRQCALMRARRRQHGEQALRLSIHGDQYPSAIEDQRDGTNRLSGGWVQIAPSKRASQLRCQRSKGPLELLVEGRLSWRRLQRLA